MYLKMAAPDIGFQFEWNPEARALYSVNLGDGSKHEQIAANIFHPEQAHMAATLWCRGYRARMREIGRQGGKKQYHLLAEGGVLGTKGGAVGGEEPQPTTTPGAFKWDDDLG